MKRIPTRTIVTAGLVALILAGGGAASAFWTLSGAGAGAGATGTVLPVTLTSGTPTAGLFPGGTASVVLTASNPNSDVTRISTLSLDTSEGTGGFSVDAGHAACGVASLSYTSQNNGGAGWSVPAKVGPVNGTLSITLTNALAMAASAPNACQGATFTVYLAAGP